MKHYRLIIALLIALGAMGSAHANIPLPAMFGFRMPSWIAYLTFGLSFVGVVVIEGLVIRAVSKMPQREAMVIALRVNVFTTLFGFLAFYEPFLFFGTLFLVIPIADWMHRGRGWGILHSLCVGLIPVLIVTAWYYLGIFVLSQFTTLNFWASLLPAFALTVLLECFWAQLRSHHRHVLRAIIAGNVASYLCLAALLLISGIDHRQGPLNGASPLSYFGIPAAVRRGDIDLALDLHREAIALHRGEVPRVTWFFAQVEEEPWWRNHRYMAFTEVSIARTFERAGYYEAALIVVEEALNSGLLVESEYEDLTDDLDKLTEMRDRLRTLIEGQSDEPSSPDSR